MIPKPSKSMMIIAVGVIAVILIGVVAPMLIGGDGWNPTGEIGEKYDIEGRVHLSKTSYATSWQTNGQSEDIVAVAQVRELPGHSILHKITHYRYKAFDGDILINTLPVNTNDWISAPPNIMPTPGVWYDLSPWIFNIDGSRTGELTVVLEVKMSLITGQTSFVGPISWDGAYLKSGEGELYITSGDRSYEEGEKVDIFVRTGWSDSWTVKLYPPTTRPNLFTPITLDTPGNDIRKTIQVTIEDGWFMEGDRQGNTFRVELWTTLFQYAFTDIFTIDDLSRAPEKPELTSVTNDNVLTVTATAEATYKPIEEFGVWAWYGSTTMPSTQDSESWILYDKSYAPQNANGENYTITFDATAKVNYDGNVYVRVIAFDEDGRGSEHAFLQAVVEDGEFDEVDHGDRQKGGYQWTILAIVITLVTLFLLYIISVKIPGIPYDKRFILIIIIASIGAALTYAAGMGWL